MKSAADFFRYVFDKFYIGALTGLIVSDVVDSMMPKHGSIVTLIVAVVIYTIGSQVANMLHGDKR